ncbi:MAG: hypothetical protein A3F14_00540 [Gammaproteobacteria bacterium RIFCSPHIGHO2_12_FULL_43_28]|nr:MAG: hypothetical protein A3F14_00540 [Gammaproteobacteria bacterium RIFCSPHIGHO2_12_FULL_43_28]
MIEKLYPYRFVMALIMMVTVSALYWINEISPLRREIKSLTNKIDQLELLAPLLQKKVTQLKYVNNKNPRDLQRMNEDSLQTLFTFIERHDLSLENVMVNDSSRNHAPFSVRMTVEGGIESMLAFINAIDNQVVMMSILDIDYQSGDNGLVRLQLHLQVLNDMNQPVALNKIGVNNKLQRPFCDKEENKMLESRIDKNELTHYPIKEIRMMGWLQSPHHQTALLLLPNGALVEAVIGQIIGQEKGWLIELNESSLKVKLPTHEIITLHISTS